VKAYIAHLIDWYQHTLDSGGYVLVAILMAIESTVLPVPSELVIPFAAHRAHETGKFSVIGIVIAGTIGSWVGASIMYWASRLAGRPLVLRYGKYALVPETKLHAAERWCARYGSFGVFAARLLPVVRHLIGIPMGIVKMDFKLYSIFTFVGSAVWCSVLAWVGIKAGQNSEHIKWWVVGFVVVLAVIYYLFVHRHMRQHPTEQDKQT
jgi:membrane protein DedA with SNARE-associated domain